MKTTKKLLAVLLSVLMLLSAFAVAASARGGEEPTPDWQPVKVSGDPTLTKGDLFMDLASVKDAYIEHGIFQNLCDSVEPKDPAWGEHFNNFEIAACEMFAEQYPVLWADALQESAEADHSGEFDKIQNAWYIFYEKVAAAYPELGLTDWSKLAPYGYDYICAEHPDVLAQVRADAEEDFAMLENAKWFYDANFTTPWNWLKAEVEGSELPYIPEEIKEAFSEYGVEWQPVAVSAAAAADGGYFLNGTTPAPEIDEEQLEFMDAQRDWVFDQITRDFSSFPATLKSYPITYTTRDNETIVFENDEQVWAYVNAQVDQMIEDYKAETTDYYAHYFDGATLFVNPDEESMFQIKMTQTVSEHGMTYEMTNVLPFAEKTSNSTPVSAEVIWPCISTLNWTWTDENTASVAIAPAIGVGVVYLDATVTAEETTAPQVGVEGVKTATATADYNGVAITATKTFPIPALEPEETPVTPETPETPDTPSDGGNKFAGDFLSKLFAWLTELFEMFTRWITAA